MEIIIRDDKIVKELRLCFHSSLTEGQTLCECDRLVPDSPFQCHGHHPG